MHHLRLQGAMEEIDRFMIEVRTGRFGGQVVQFQRYSPGDAAANIVADVTLDLSKLREAAREHRLSATIQFFAPSTDYSQTSAPQYFCVNQTRPSRVIET
jgi:hypothetical protein